MVCHCNCKERKVYIFHLADLYLLLKTDNFQFKLYWLWDLSCGSLWWAKYAIYGENFSWRYIKIHKFYFCVSVFGRTFADVTVLKNTWHSDRLLYLVYYYFKENKFLSGPGSELRLEFLYNLQPGSNAIRPNSGTTFIIIITNGHMSSVSNAPPLLKYLRLSFPLPESVERGSWGKGRERE